MTKKEIAAGLAMISFQAACVLALSPILVPTWIAKKIKSIGHRKHSYHGKWND